MMEHLTPDERRGLKQGAVLAIVMFAGVIYYHYMLTMPQIEGDKITIEKVNTEIAELDDRIKAMDEAKKNWETMKEKRAVLERISAKLPNSIDAPGFFQALVKILTITRVEYTQLTPENPAQRTVYTEIPYGIVSRARYHDFGHFLNLIEENPDRFMRVKTFTIENKDERPSVHPVTVRIGTFMFNTKG